MLYLSLLICQRCTPGVGVCIRPGSCGGQHGDRTKVWAEGLMELHFVELAPAPPDEEDFDQIWGDEMLMAMFQPQNGREGFRHLSVPPHLTDGSTKLLSPEVMTSLIERECELRLHPATLMAFANNQVHDRRLLDTIQLQACHEVGAYEVRERCTTLIWGVHRVAFNSSKELLSICNWEIQRVV
jgi:hypothetical protein